MKTLVGMVVLVAVVVGVYWLNDVTRDEKGKSLLNVAGETAIQVKVARPVRRDIVRTVQAPGDVEALSEVDISGEVVAKILEMPVEEGDTVKKGDLLCRLDDANYRARVASAEANVAKLEATIMQAQADLRKAQRDHLRQIRLLEKDATSNIEVKDAKTALVWAQAMVEIREQELIDAKAKLQSATDDLAKTVITSPIDGVVSQRFAKLGEVVVTGTMNNPGTRIMVISDMSKMQVRCRVDEGDAPSVKPDQVARIYLQSDTVNSIPGHVLRVATKGTKPVGRDVVTFETLVIVDANDSRVKPGMSANIEIEVASSDDTLTIPVEAVVHRKRRDLPEALVKQYDEAHADRLAVEKRRLAEYLMVVFRVKEDVAHPVLVKTGISDPRSVEILNGLTHEDRIVTGPFRSLDQLKDGSKIKIEDDGHQEDRKGAESEEGEKTVKRKDHPALTENR